MIFEDLDTLILFLQLSRGTSRYILVVVVCPKRTTNQIRLYRKKLTASRTNGIVVNRHVIVASLRCYFLRRCQEKSDRIGMETAPCFSLLPIRSDFSSSDIDVSAHSGLCPFGTMSNRDYVRSGSCPFGIDPFVQLFG